MQVLYLGPEDSRAVVERCLPAEFRVHHAVDEAVVDRLLPDTDVILDAYMRVRFPEERLRRAERLRLVVTATTGADHIDASELERRGIPLLTLRGQREVLRNITPAAEHSWLLLMACARRLPPALSHVLAGEWDRNQFPGIMLRDRTIGIVGCGRIGEWVSRYAQAFGMERLGYDPFLEEFPPTITATDLDTLLTRSDFVSLHVPLTEQTAGLLGREEIAKMKCGAVLVNTSRGDIVDEGALLDALRGGQIGAAGLDVLTGEPDIAEHPLVEYARKHDNLLITPHIGGFSPDALAYVLAFSCRRITDSVGA